MKALELTSRLQAVGITKQKVLKKNTTTSRWQAAA